MSPRAELWRGYRHPTILHACRAAAKGLGGGDGALRGGGRRERPRSRRMDPGAPIPGVSAAVLALHAGTARALGNTNSQQHGDGRLGQLTSESRPWRQRAAATRSTASRMMPLADHRAGLQLQLTAGIALPSLAPWRAGKPRACPFCFALLPLPASKRAGSRPGVENPVAAMVTLHSRRQILTSGGGRAGSGLPRAAATFAAGFVCALLLAWHR